jgi:hypothetical protein
MKQSIGSVDKIEDIIVAVKEIKIKLNTTKYSGKINSKQVFITL